MLKFEIKRIAPAIRAMAVEKVFNKEGSRMIYQLCIGWRIN